MNRTRLVVTIFSAAALAIVATVVVLTTSLGPANTVTTAHKAPTVTTMAPSPVVPTSPTIHVPTPPKPPTPPQVSRIPQHDGGDRDADNEGGPSDGDGNL
jgi:hypothetical protein